MFCKFPSSRSPQVSVYVKGRLIFCNFRFILTMQDMYFRFFVLRCRVVLIMHYIMYGWPHFNHCFFVFLSFIFLLIIIFIKYLRYLVVSCI